MGDQKNPHDKPKTIRQDRFEIADPGAHLEIEGQKHRIINYSIFGVAIESASNFPLGSIHTGYVKIENIEICSVHARVVRVEDSQGAKRVAFEVLDGQINTERVNAVSESLQAVSALRTQVDHFAPLSMEYKFNIYELHDSLLRMEKSVNELESKRKVLSANDREAFEKAVIDVVAPPIHTAIRECNIRLSQVVQDAPKEVLHLAFEFFRSQLQNFIFQSPFAERSYSKPLGYAGDFEMMNLIYRNEDFGGSLFGRCMERAIQMHLEPGAVRNRAIYLKEKIAEAIKAHPAKKFRILSVASGPAFELQNLVTDFDPKDCHRVEFFLLDQDVLSLKAAQRSILNIAKQRSLQFNLRLINRAIRQVLTEGVGESGFDLIYSAGLFDYFSDSVAQRAAQMLFQSLKDDGELVIGNFASSTPNRFGMLTLFDWHLILRSEEDLKRLFTFEGAKLKVESEPNGINLFCSIRRE